jgi:hypothetical protein
MEFLLPESFLRFVAKLEWSYWRLSPPLDGAISIEMERCIAGRWVSLRLFPWQLVFFGVDFSGGLDLMKHSLIGEGVSGARILWTTSYNLEFRESLGARRNSSAPGLFCKP